MSSHTNYNSAKNKNTQRVFGQSTRRQSKNGGASRYQRQMGQRRGKGGGNGTAMAMDTEEQELAQRRMEMRAKKKREGEALDERFGYARFSGASGGGDGTPASRRGWIFNMLATTVPAGSSSNDAHDDSMPDTSATPSGPERAAVDLYFLSADGSTFKSTVLYDPYFYLIASPPPLSSHHSHTHTTEDEHHHHANYYESLISALLKNYEHLGLKSAQTVQKVDLDSVNHLGAAGQNGRTMLKLTFDTVSQLMDVRKLLQAILKDNQKKEGEKLHHHHHSSLFIANHANLSAATTTPIDPMLTLMEMREYDVPYLVRVCIDLQIRTGAWYTVTTNPNDIGVTLSQQDVETKANPTFLAFDIECTKAPLKFPDANIDSIFMISYMVNGQGYLILSRHVVSSDVKDFEYTPKPTYPGPFHIYNELTEEDLIRRFLTEWQAIRPQICVTYNGDFFDWPFLEQRAALYGLDLATELGVSATSESAPGADGEYRGRCCVHMDAFAWVKRDSYLPQGAQGLKAVTKYKLGYDPVEVDPEDMVHYARERPVHMASYSVSDAVATYYLYEKYVHLFVFSLCTIIPMGPEDVLRKGSGTLCEALLMVQACGKGIICPNKQVDPLAKFHDGHLLESETYIGGKVECLETGVYRSDIEYQFDLKSSAYQGLIDNVDRDLTFAIEVEGGLDRKKITNYDEIRTQIVEKLEKLRDRPKRVEKPYVYHLDVGAMYPNIILTNRLQPGAIVDDATCAACDFNQSKNKCKRKMEWIWRVDYNPASKSEYDHVKNQLSHENFEDGKSFHELDEKKQASLVSTRLKKYSKNAYNKTKVTEEITKTDTVCMRENDFYVNTVRQFRDRRYEYKKLTKKWGRAVKGAKDAKSKKEAEDRALVYDSLQIAHKCILNSFYGYVMRKGARWRSMEMAGIVTKNGADLITQARILVEQIGRPLELDTDGIWCILPQSFPDVFFFNTDDGDKLKLEYPCIMLNADVHNNFTNHQYQTLKDPEKRTYETRSECSIFFEVDGPYRCMVIPASTEEGKLLKKRYAVFNEDGSLAELKGFELKRRGELELIKTFQSQVFERFLDGDTLEACYDSVAEIANHWIDVLDTQGESLDTEELVDLISENRNMSRQLEDYGDQKGTSQTTARRLGEFLGAEIIKDKGLNCKFIIAERPHGAPVTERAIPTAIWKAEPAVMKHYLRKWLKSVGMEDDDFDIRNVLDWDYYRDRLGKTIQKIITIPAALQNVRNPVPRIAHPDWLQRTVRKMNDRYQQQSITRMFGAAIQKKGMSTNKDNSTKENQLAITNSNARVMDIEDMAGETGKRVGRPVVHSMKRKAIVEKVQNHVNDHDSDKFVTKDVSQEEASTSGKVPLTKVTFNEWLAKKKEKWNFNERRKRNRTANSMRSNLLGKSSSSIEPQSKKQRKAAGSMMGYIRDAALALTHYELHIVEIRELSVSEMGSNFSSSSGEFVVWAMLGNGSLQKLQLAVPRTLYVNCRKEVTELSTNMMSVKRVEKHLPHNKASKFLYEVTLSENIYRSKDWLQQLCPSNDVESFYEMDTPLLLRSLLHLGCMSRLNTSASGGTSKYQLSDLKRVDRPSDGEYLHSELTYKRIFFYESLHARSKTGLVAAFLMDGTNVEEEDGTLDQDPGQKSNLRLSSTCHLWIVKPGGERGQKNVSKKNIALMFSQLLEEIRKSDGDENSDYARLSPDSVCTAKTLLFVEDEKAAFAGVNDVLNAYTQSNNGPTFLLLNSTKATPQLRKAIPSCNSFPLVPLSFPPGLDPSSSFSALPSLNWEPQAAQLCLEAYFYMGAVSFQKQMRYSRFCQIPIGNLGSDAVITSYDVSFARHLQKSRSLLWASETPGCPDVGYRALARAPGSNMIETIIDTSDTNELTDSNDIWGDDDENISPVIRCPGAYRSVCVEIDVHDLAIAALTDTKAILAGEANTIGSNDQNLLSNSNQNKMISSSSAPLGDEISTALSLPLLRTLAQSWLRNASEFNSDIADHLLSYFYRLVSSPEAMLNDPALHRVLLSLMKSTFYRLLGEFQRLGSKIICATFNRILLATNKKHLSDAKEYIDFVVSTIQKKEKSNGGLAEGLARLSLRPSNFYTHYLFLNEQNFGGILFENREPENEDEDALAFQAEVTNGVSITKVSIVPTVVSGWNIMHYLAGEDSQEYFRAIVARFSKDVYEKENAMEKETNDEIKLIAPQSIKVKNQRLLSSSPVSGDIVNFKRDLVSKHFASYLTRAVAEIIKNDDGPESFPQLPGSHMTLTSPVLEFARSVLVVLDLDPETQHEVDMLKKSLFTQIGVQEYSLETKWRNPCASFILPDTFCLECHESRDIDLCMLPSPDEDEQELKWACENCGASYDRQSIERRLVDIVEKKCIRYQLQDLRCSKTGLVATHMLARQSECSAPLKPDIGGKGFMTQFQILYNLSKFYNLEWLNETLEGVLQNFAA